jgi:hypothetical protein
MLIYRAPSYLILTQEICAILKVAHILKILIIYIEWVDSWLLSIILVDCV